MENGVHGSLGAHVQLLVVLGKRSDHDCATIHLSLTMDVLVLEMRLKYPGVTFRLVQVPVQVYVSNAGEKEEEKHFVMGNSQLIIGATLQIRRKYIPNPNLTIIFHK